MTLLTDCHSKNAQLWRRTGHRTLLRVLDQPKAKFAGDWALCAVCVGLVLLSLVFSAVWVHFLRLRGDTNINMLGRAVMNTQ